MEENEINAMLAKLDEPFPAEDIDWRIQGTPIDGRDGTKRGLALAYITNRAVQERLDLVVGKANWRNEYAPGPIGGIMCGISIRINGEWITKWDGADATQVEATKGGFSDSMKRAAVEWGIGRYLYDLGETWARATSRGRSWFIKDEDKPKLPTWALPKTTVKRPTEKAQTNVSAPEGEDALPVQAPAESKAEGKATTESLKNEAQSAGKAAASKPKLTLEEKVEKAKAYLIPEGSGLPGAGLKNLGKVLDENEKLGLHVLKILSGNVEGLKVPAFKPQTSDDEKVVAAAQFLLEHVQKQA